MDSNELPSGLALTALDESFREDPYPVLKRLRDEEPLHQDVLLARYKLTRYDDVRRLLRDPDYFTDPRKSREGSFARLLLRDDDSQVSMLLLDEPEHRRLRGLVNNIFTPRAVEAWRPRIIEVIEDHLAQLGGPEFDLMADYAGPIPTVIIAEMIGIPADLHQQFKRWSDTCIEAEFAIAPPEELRASGQAATEALQGYFAEHIAYRRRQPGQDLVSRMLAARFEGEALSDMEIINQCELLLIAGNVTTSDLIGNGVRALLQHPDQLVLLREQPGLIVQAVEEILRYDTPVTSIGRITPGAVTIRGCPIGKGEALTLSLAAANRDPTAFPEPDRFDITRQDNAHQSFGGGRHLCLGAWLARIEAQEAILRLVQQFPRLSLARRGWRFSPTPSFRGMDYCWLATGTGTEPVHAT